MEDTYIYGMDKKPSRKISIPALRPVVVGQADPRLKNSLKNIASLLQLQAADDVRARPDEVLTDAAARIETVAHWHAFRAQARNAGRRTVALDAYLQAFSDHFVEVFPAQSRIMLLVNADPVQVPARVAGVLGQIVNELVIKTVRQAFGPKRPGAIQVECGTDADGAIALQVGDDTRGHRNGYGLRAPGTFGMQIVKALVKQLGGRFAAAKPGARICYRVTVPIPGRASSAGRKQPIHRR